MKALSSPQSVRSSVGKIAVGHGNQHADRQEPSIEHLEELALGVSQGEGPGFQVLDVALQYERTVFVAVEGLGELGGDVQAGGVLAVEDDLITG